MKQEGLTFDEARRRVENNLADTRALTPTAPEPSS